MSRSFDPSNLIAAASGTSSSLSRHVRLSFSTESKLILHPRLYIAVDENHSPVKRVMTSSSPLPLGSFVTCSADNTLRIWNTDPVAQKASQWRSIYAKEVLHTIDWAANDDSSSEGRSKASISSGSSIPTNARPHVDLSTGLPDYELPDKPPGTTCPRAAAYDPGSW